MSQFDKLIRRIRTLDNNMRFRELCKVLESLGYTMSAPRGGSSHRVFRKPGRTPITIPQHDPIKEIYVIMVREAIEREESDEQVRTQND